jgi:hypothetical protein
METRSRSERSEGTLVLFPGALGDAVCLEPAVARLASCGPVTLYARGAAGEIAALFPARPRVARLDAHEIALLFAPCGGGVREDDPGLAFLRRYRRVRSFTGAAAEELRARAARHRDARVEPFPSRPGTLHASHVFLRGALGDGGVYAPLPRLVVDGARGGRRGPGGLVLHPGSGGARKRVPDQVFRDLARAWSERGGTVEMLLGPAERESAAAWRLAGASVLEPPDATALAEVVMRSRAYVGHDSGPSHVAAALGVPTIVLFASTAPESFGPRGAAVTWLDVRADPAEAAGIAARAWRCLAPYLP